MDLSFPPSSIDAARRQLGRWEVDPSLPLDQLLPVLKQRFEPLVEDRYGVEEAILERKRMRVLDERGFERQFNCAELGANLLPLFQAMGYDPRILRYMPREGSTHFALLLGDSIFDPLFSLAGPVKLVKGGVYCPTGTAERSKLYKCEWDVLTTDDILRHINFINSPVGFFDYYMNGQRIRSGSYLTQDVEWDVVSDDEGFLVRMTGTDGLVDAYTFQRGFWYEEGVLKTRDKRMLHFDVKWCEPDEECYVETIQDGSSEAEMFGPSRYRANVLGFAEAARMMIGDDWEEFLRSQERNILGPLEDLAAAVEQNAAAGKAHEGDYDYYCQRLMPYINSMDEDAKRNFLWSYINSEYLRSRRKFLGFPTKGRFYDKEKDGLRTYVAARDRHFRRHIDELLASDAVRLLLDDYRTALGAKQALATL